MEPQPVDLFLGLDGFIDPSTPQMDWAGGVEDDMLGGMDDEFLAGMEDEILSGTEDNILGSIEDETLGGIQDKILGGVQDEVLGQGAGSSDPINIDRDKEVISPPKKWWRKSAKQKAALTASFEAYGPGMAPHDEIARLATQFGVSCGQIEFWWRKEQARRRDATELRQQGAALSNQVKFAIDAKVREMKSFSDTVLNPVADHFNLELKVVRAYVLNTYTILYSPGYNTTVTNIVFAETLRSLRGQGASVLEPIFRSIMARPRPDIRAVLPTFPLYSIHPTLSSPLAGLWANLLTNVIPQSGLQHSQLASPWGDVDSPLLVLLDNAPVNDEPKSVYNLKDKHTNLIIRKLGLDGLVDEKCTKRQSVLISSVFPHSFFVGHGALNPYMSFTRSILSISTANVCITIGEAARNAVQLVLRGDDIEVVAEKEYSFDHGKGFLHISLQYLTRQDKADRRAHRIIFGFPRFTHLTPTLESRSLPKITAELREVECILNTAILLALGHVPRPSLLAEQGRMLAK